MHNTHSFQDKDNLPPGVDVAHREDYLPDDQFIKLLGCNRVTFKVRRKLTKLTNCCFLALVFDVDFRNYRNGASRQRRENAESSKLHSSVIQNNPDKKRNYSCRA